eukprot:scaffold93427_cov68-Phaeocystis_antarctica.AAC.1
MASRLWSIEWLAPESLISASMAHGDPEDSWEVAQGCVTCVLWLCVLNVNADVGSADYLAHRQNISPRQRMWYTRAVSRC